MPRLLLVLFLLAPSLSVQAQVAMQPKIHGIESGSYIWNSTQSESLLALRAKADVQRGAETYRLCHGCHKAGATGTPDGVYPRLAGQHATVLMKELIDVRIGLRDNQTMYPFANERELSMQDLADLSAYISTLPSKPDNAQGEGKTLTRGKALYLKDCQTCHGKNGEGDAEKFYPKLAYQHFPYLKQEVSDIAKGLRRNANPHMVNIVKHYSDDDIMAVADYISRLSLPK